MTAAQIEIQLLAILVALACVIPGCFLVLRKMAMISDAISHAILPGIVIGFFLHQDLGSPLLMITATASGLLAVVLIEWLRQSELVKADAAIGLVFPALFSLGVVLISRYAETVHLDIDAVLVGEMTFAPFNRWYINGVDLGPKAIWVMGTILLINLLLLGLFYNALKLTTIDASFALTLGLSPQIIHYGLMAVTSLTTVGAFDAVGAVLVIAFVIVPAATAYLITHRLSHLLIVASFIAIIASISGYWLAYAADLSIAGCITVVLGGVFLFTQRLTKPLNRLMQKHVTTN
ncbi:metal ABC transporter permease [Ostreibacterium oceani]|uniref:Metal ABC transporter permease n=1 Tax=Ostreibacterium oceani TaxID=2654998 RepID=A0A6N7EY06_9GAMM|nr:metal ABC transporter permease [Ostreibacterium oceani]MPV85348.1 metal ABC transporter permease [Ostreibacterium oceani]